MNVGCNLPPQPQRTRLVSEVEGLELEDSGERRQASTGAQRDRAKGKGRYDLNSPVADAALARINELGAEKYSDRNWEKGMPLSWYLDSCRRHLVRWVMGETGEDHLAQAFWNLHSALHTREMIRLGLLPKELDDLPYYLQKTQKKE